MAKKCTICGDPAEFCIKDSSECYCHECAQENFSDLSLLQKVEAQAQKLKNIIKREIEEKIEE